MKGRHWMLLGIAAGIAVAAGHLPYLAGAGRALTSTAERVVQDGQGRIIHSAAQRGAPKRAVLGVGAVLAVLVPGLTALLLIVAARATLRLRALVGFVLVALGAASFAYEPAAKAGGVVLLVLVVAALAVALSGLVVVAPLAFTAALIGAEFLPTLLHHRVAATAASVSALHEAMFGRPGTPLGLELLLLVVALVPFAVAARLALRS